MTINVNFVMDEDSEKLIDSIIEKTDAKSYKEVFVRAVNLYEWLLRKIEEGNDLVLVGKSGGQTLEVILPGVEEDQTPREEDNSNMN